MNYSKAVTIDGFPKEITINRRGQVYSRGKLLKNERTKAGHLRIHCSVNGVVYRESVHRLVAKAFIKNPESLPCVNHIDGNKSNNHADNLEWCTHGHNLSHAFKIGLRDCSGIKNTSSRLSENDVREIRRLYIKGKHGNFNSYGLARKYNVSPRCIADVVRYRTYKNVI